MQIKIDCSIFLIDFSLLIGLKFNVFAALVSEFKELYIPAWDATSYYSLMEGLLLGRGSDREWAHDPLAILHATPPRSCQLGVT